jgi:2-oxoglutarate dehydrogenase E2 component (dihydrolipoamide succinyltransferase)
MTIEVKVPALPESVSDGTLVNWKKQPGQAVQRGENLVDLETDKVVLDIPAPGGRCARRDLCGRKATSSPPAT